jgi:hypothetical protein
MLDYDIHDGGVVNVDALPRYPIPLTLTLPIILPFTIPILSILILIRNRVVIVCSRLHGQFAFFPLDGLISLRPLGFGLLFLYCGDVFDLS